MPTLAVIKISGFFGGLRGLSKQKIRVLGGLEGLGGFRFKKHFIEKIQDHFFHNYISM
jgi:uncharacterized membrane protein required for colicin V production